MIRISGKPTGNRALMYSAIGQKGLRKMVPTYEAKVLHENGTMVFRFEVTRSHRRQVFNGAPAKDYGQSRACPPSRFADPYWGRITTSGRLKFAIMLYEGWCPRRESLRGVGRHTRRGIKIHQGPATSYGCMAVAGGKKGYRVFQKTFKRLEKDFGNRFIVAVEELED